MNEWPRPFLCFSKRDTCENKKSLERLSAIQHHPICRLLCEMKTTIDNPLIISLIVEFLPNYEDLDYSRVCSTFVCYLFSFAVVQFTATRDILQTLCCPDGRLPCVSRASEEFSSWDGDGGRESRGHWWRIIFSASFSTRHLEPSTSLVNISGCMLIHPPIT